MPSTERNNTLTLLNNSVDIKKFTLIESCLDVLSNL
ncbi:MAG: hypothetical protein ACI936_004014 [Paraglaciecola sp.]|jgi:hypothetical protein